MPFFGLSLTNLLEQLGRPAKSYGVLLPALSYPSEHLSLAPSVHLVATLIASATAAGGFLLATLFYGLHKLDAADVKRQFIRSTAFLVLKWYFVELYAFIFIKPLFFVSSIISKIDKNLIRRLDRQARRRREITLEARRRDRPLRGRRARETSSAIGPTRRPLAQGGANGKLRQYVMFIVVGYRGAHRHHAMGPGRRMIFARSSLIHASPHDARTTQNK